MAGQPCKACLHPRAGEVKAAMLRLESERSIGKRFGLSRESLARHRPHVAESIRRQKKDADVHGVAILEDSHRKLTEIIERNLAAGDDPTAIKAIKERRETVAYQFPAKIRLSLEPSEADLSKRAVEYLEGLGYTVTAP